MWVINVLPGSRPLVVLQVDFNEAGEEDKQPVLHGNGSYVAAPGAWTANFLFRYLSEIWVKPQLSAQVWVKDKTRKAHIRKNAWLCKKTMPFRNHEKTFFNGCSETLTEGIVLYSPFLLQIDTLGKWLRCLTNVCFAKLKKKLKISEQTQIIWVSSSPCLCAINVGPSSCWVPENSTFHLYKIELKGSTVTECGARRSPPFAHLESSLAPRGNVCKFWRSLIS